MMKSRKSEDTRQPHDRSRSSSVNNRGDDKRSASISRTNTFDNRSTETASTVKLTGPVPRSPRSIAPSVNSMSMRARGAGPQARDARVPQESVADFADFIRGSGPTGGPVAPPVPLSRSGTVTGSVSNAMRSLNSTAAMSKTSIDSGKVSTFSSRQRYQAREAVVNKDDNSDLIDFIRRGPPSAAGTTDHRIPRNVAPFRTTMDSDQMSGAVGGRAVDASIPDLRYSAASTSVTDSSMGSAAGLLKKDHKQPPPRAGANQSASNMFDGPEDMPIPKRKTRRVKDPYAIDLSDEDDEFDMPEAAPSRRPGPAAKEESLLDFLNSVPPPVETNPVLFDIPQTRNQQQQPPAPKKKASASSLMARFTRHSSSGTNTSSRGLSSSSGSHMGFSGGFDSRSLISRAGSTMTGRGRNHVPIQVNIPPGLDKYGVNPAMASSNGSRPSGASISSARVPMKRFEPREAQPTSSRATQDLAEFFRSSGP